MSDIIVAKPFTLSLTHDDVRRFVPGVYKEQPPEVAEHWFTKSHLATDGKLPEPALSAPLTNEERASVKSSLDAAEKRAADAEADAKAVREERDGIRSGMDKLVGDNAALRSRVASLEADLDKVTKPTTTPAAKPATPGK